MPARSGWTDVTPAAPDAAAGWTDVTSAPPQPLPAAATAPLQYQPPSLEPPTLRPPPALPSVEEIRRPPPPTISRSARPPVSLRQPALPPVEEVGRRAAGWTDVTVAP